MKPVNGFTKCLPRFPIRPILQRISASRRTNASNPSWKNGRAPVKEPAQARPPSQSPREPSSSGPSSSAPSSSSSTTPLLRRTSQIRGAGSVEAKAARQLIELDSEGRSDYGAVFDSLPSRGDSRGPNQLPHSPPSDAEGTPEPRHVSAKLLTSIFSQLDYQRARTSLILRLFAWMSDSAEYRPKLDCFVHSRVMSILSRRDDPDGALAIFEAMKLNGIEPDLVSYNTAIGVCAKAGRPGRAFQLYRELRSRLSPDVFTLASLLTACQHPYEWSSRAASPVQGAAATATQGSAQQRNGAEGGSDGAVAAAAPAGVSTSPVVPAAAAAAGVGPNGAADSNGSGSGTPDLQPQWRRAMELFKEFGRMKIKPNVVAYTALLTTLQRAGQVDRALQVFREMESSGIVPDVVTYNNMIAACSRDGLWEKAWSLLTDMKLAGIEPSTVTYNSLISACEKGGEPDRALEVYERMLRDGRKSFGYADPSAITFNAVILACGRAGRLSDCLRLLSAMESRGLHPDSATLCALMLGCEKSDPPDGRTALEVFRRLTSPSVGAAPNTICYNALLWALVRSGQLDDALQAYQDMLNRSKSDDERLAVAALAAADGAAGSDAPPPQEDAYYSPAPAVTRAPRCRPDQVTYQTLIMGCERQGQWQRALELYEDMTARRVPATGSTYVSLISACEKGWQWSKAVELFERMQQERVEAPFVQLYARRLMYGFGGMAARVLPETVAAAANYAIETGRAARRWVDRRSSGAR